MWNDLVDAHRQYLPRREAVARLFRQETTTHFHKAASSLLSAVRWTLRTRQSRTIVMLHLGLRMIGQALALRRQTRTVACEPPVLNGAVNPNAKLTGDRKRAKPAVGRPVERRVGGADS